jgi:hypothetical protein
MSIFLLSWLVLLLSALAVHKTSPEVMPAMADVMGAMWFSACSFCAGSAITGFLTMLVLFDETKEKAERERLKAKRLKDIEKHLGRVDGHLMGIVATQMAEAEILERLEKPNGVGGASEAVADNPGE